MFLINDGFNTGLYWEYQRFSKLLVSHFLFSHGDLVIFETIILPHWEVHVTGYRQSETPEPLLGFPHQHLLGPLSACFTGESPFEENAPQLPINPHQGLVWFFF